MNATFGIAICEEIVPYGAAWPSFVRLVVISIAEERKSFLRAWGFARAACAGAWGQELSRMGSACRFAVAFFDAGRGASAVNRARRFERTSWDLRSEARLRREPSEQMRAARAPALMRREFGAVPSRPRLRLGSACPFGFGAFACVGRGAVGLSNLSLFCVGLDRRPLPTSARRGQPKGRKEVSRCGFCRLSRAPEIQS